MIENQLAHHSIPFLKSDEEQLAKIRRQLEGMFRELRLVQDVIMVCGGVCGSVNSDFDDEVEHVLRRCASDRMHTVLKTLTQIVERFGGTTELSDEGQDETQ
jgi:putative lipoic acid-binding regulatory protein